MNCRNKFCFNDNVRVSKCVRVWLRDERREEWDQYRCFACGRIWEVKVEKERDDGAGGPVGG